MAINAKIDLKKPVLEEISAQVEGAQCVLLVNYSGLTVAQDTQLRKELREAGVHYKVYKNTMMKRAFAGTALEWNMLAIISMHLKMNFPKILILI